MVQQKVYKLLYPNDNYDIVVNTYKNSSEECADMIIDLLKKPDCYRSFK